MAKIKATIGGVAYEINAVTGITANNTEINVPLTIDGEGGGVGGYTEANTVTVLGSSLTLGTIPVTSSSYVGYTVAHGLSSAPKAVIITSDCAVDGTVKGKIVGGYFFTDKVRGYNSVQSGAFYIGAGITANATTGNATGTPYFLGDSQSPLASWAVFGCDATNFYFNKAGANIVVEDTATYTFLFLA